MVQSSLHTSIGPTLVDQIKSDLQQDISPETLEMLKAQVESRSDLKKLREGIKKLKKYISKELHTELSQQLAEIA